MRLLIDARPFADPKTGGVGRVALELARTLAQKSDLEIVLATTGWKNAQSHPCANTQLIHLKLPNKLWSLLSFLGLVSLDKEVEKRVGKIDALFLPNVGFVGNIAKPYVLLIHDLSYWIEPRWFIPKTRWWHKAVRAEKLIKNATRLLTVSETTKQDAIRWLGIAPEKISVISLGSTLTPPTQPTGPSPRPSRYVLALGSNDPRKNSATAITTVRELKKDSAFTDLELVLLGGPNRPTDTELQTLYANASAFLYPSWYEGFGLPLHEASSFGIPCIASTAGALPETAPVGTIFADPSKPHHWVSALRLILTKSKRTIPETRSWQNAGETLLACFRPLV